MCYDYNFGPGTKLTVVGKADVPRRVPQGRTLSCRMWGKTDDPGPRSWGPRPALEG